jgi:hypothetical protein
MTKEDLNGALTLICEGAGGVLGDPQTTVTQPRRGPPCIRKSVRPSAVHHTIREVRAASRWAAFCCILGLLSAAWDRRRIINGELLTDFKGSGICSRNRNCKKIQSHYSRYITYKLGIPERYVNLALLVVYCTLPYRMLVFVWPRGGLCVVTWRSLALASAAEVVLWPDHCCRVSLSQPSRLYY